MNEEFVADLALIVGFTILAYLGFKAVQRTKRTRKIGFFGATAKSIDSYMSSHQANLKEMETIIKHEVKKTDPQDE